VRQVAIHVNSAADNDKADKMLELQLRLGDECGVRITRRRSCCYACFVLAYRLPYIRTYIHHQNLFAPWRSFIAELRMRSISPRGLVRPVTGVSSVSHPSLISKENKPEILSAFIFTDIVVFVKGKNKYALFRCCCGCCHRRASINCAGSLERDAHLGIEAQSNL